ncbi:TspO/MBR family protein [uncultured Litoreibacter sp.]|uniref:tryptophan-rich sensory protein TspO n=1 Tax=uncultured Litoreibacter sp. TaxID=1392394 RepID=UPI002612DD97|nr:TspO/MBR family protein [uncultured Litoreibacter sp.]
MDLVLFSIFLISCGAAGATGGVFPPGPWYKTLNKPSWTPPDWVFPVAWTTIYLLISFAGARIGGMEGNGYALAFWAMQLGFSTLWSPVFFGLRRLRGALIIMVPLWLAVLGATLANFQLDFWAGLAFVPYLVWVTVAAVLNFTVAQMNPDQKPIDLASL